MRHSMQRPFGAMALTLTVSAALLVGSPALGQTRPGTNPGGYYIGNAGGVNRGGATGVYVGGYPSGYERTNGSGYYIGGNIPPGPTQGDLGNIIPPYSEAPPRRTRNAPAVFHIRVPAEAKIRFDGQKTDQRGPRREFITPPLSPWKAYTYRIWVHWMDQGKPVDKFRQVTFYAGDNVNLDFRQP